MGYVYVVAPTGGAHFKIGRTKNWESRRLAYNTAYGQYSSHVFPVPEDTRVEAALKRQLVRRGAIIKHMTSGRDSECAEVGHNVEHLAFAVDFLIGETAGPHASAGKRTGGCGWLAWVPGISRLGCLGGRRVAVCTEMAEMAGTTGAGANRKNAKRKGGYSRKGGGRSASITTSGGGYLPVKGDGEIPQE